MASAVFERPQTCSKHTALCENMFANKQNIRS